ncbi:class I SAM-dependent methyltransferase [Candidatus Micrarchaeota archaeon]|nr:class I SAM-dependent methyltransferase [Candidatus Micrarchaeota archaeon]
MKNLPIKTFKLSCIYNTFMVRHNEPVYVTSVKPRKSSEDYVKRLVPLCSSDWSCWKSVEEKIGPIEIEIRFITREVRKLFYQDLMNSIRNQDLKGVEKALNDLKPHCVFPKDSFSKQEKWDYFARQMPKDWGPPHKIKKQVKDKITHMARRNCLEAMCGFETYFQPKEGLSVTALDYSIEALERYEIPDRPRILFDLNEIENIGDMAFFNDGFFQTIGIFFGVNYLENPMQVYLEFKRVLDDGGQLLIFGSQTAGYRELTESSFDPLVTAYQLRYLDFQVNIEAGYQDYYLVNAKKKII